MCKIDFANAFNRVSRQFLSLIFNDAALNGAFAWVWACYGRPTSMWWHEVVIGCVTGVQQGDPLGPLLFSLVLRVLTARIREVAPDLALNVWYLDDGTLIGRTDDVLAALAIISTDGPALGLHVNFSKCELWWCKENQRMHEFPPEIKRITTGGVALLGSAVGCGVFAAAELDKRVVKVTRQIEALRALEDSQIELSLLRLCLGVPNMVYAMRTMAPQDITDPLRRADEVITAALQNVVGDALPLAARTQAALPISRGGLGVRQAAPTTEAAYLSSYSAARPLVSRMLGCAEAELPVAAGVQAALDALNARAGAAGEQPWTVELLLEQRPSQEALLEACDKASFVRLLADGCLFDRARLLGVSMHQAGAWLTVLPSRSHKMAPLEHSVAVKFRLGMRCYTEDLCACPACGALSDPYGYHSTSCGTNNDRISRHTSQCDLFASSGVAAAKGTVREHKHLLPNTQERPGDITLADWLHQQTGVFDMTVVSAFLAAILSVTAVRRGHAAAQAEVLKDAHSLEPCRLQNMLFAPLAVETCGGWGRVAQATFRKLSTMIAARSGRLQSEELHWMYQRHSVAMQRDNARMILRRAPEYRPP